LGDPGSDFYIEPRAIAAVVITSDSGEGWISSAEKQLVLSSGAVEGKQIDQPTQSEID